MNELTHQEKVTVSPVTIADVGAFWKLIDKNREYLSIYFPVTLTEVTDAKTAEQFIFHKIQNGFSRHSYYFKVNFGKEMAGIVSVKSINWSILQCEIAYFVASEMQGKSIATNAIKYIVNFCFHELKMTKIFARINPENIASRKVIKKNGFMREAILKDDYRNVNGILTDSVYYSLFNN